ncbi:TniQ family protein [Sphingobium chungbukense]|jgi:hypothetical protein|uniref:TniQ domain-containing protein n=1 Tax=Sphingobium chungbukense TaxID=56193 RepID=A0A0M3AMS9_9SPHN|nr:TniQ family protein [Sphingobium chungbukense]KKW90231.1 hypothetical protein YP76_21235 [Sphingobium chungbukense]
MSGREIEPLAFRVKPLPEECFESWLRRLAARHETTPKALFRHLGIDAALADRDLAASAAPATSRASAPLAAPAWWAAPAPAPAPAAARVPDRREVMVERLAWATMVPAKAISRTFVGCERGDLLPPALRSIGCAQCWLDWLVSGAPWRIERSWILRVTTFCDRHALLLTDLAGIMGLGRTQAAERALAARVARTRAQMALFAFVKTRVLWNGMIAREQIRGGRSGVRLGSERYCSALVGNRFHYAPVRHLLLAALHTSDGLKAGRWEEIFRFDAQPARLPRKAAPGAGPQLSDLAAAIARVGLRQLDRERRRLAMVCDQLEQAKRNYPRAHLMQGLKARRAALAREVRDAATMESAAASAQRRGLQQALFYLQASGMVGAAMSAGCAEPDCSANGDLWRARLAACFDAPRFRTLLDLPGHGLRW